jgi:hypothetical protein
MDKDKDKNKFSKSSSVSREGTPPGPLRGPFSRSELDTLIANQSGLVTNPADARKWMENKGWMLSWERFDRSKLINILLITVTMLPKIPPEVVNAVRAAAFVLDDDISDNISLSLATVITNKIKAGLPEITSSMTYTQNFLEASAVQQASLLLELKEISMRSTETTTNLTNLAAKLTEAKPVTASPPSRPSLPNPAYNPSSPENITRLKQRLLQSARTILIQADPSSDSNPKPTSEQDLQALRVKLN